MQLIPSPRCVGLPIKVAKHGEEHRELVEYGNAGKGQRGTVRVAGNIVGHPLTGSGFVHFPSHLWAVGSGMEDDAGSLEPRFVGRDPFRGDPEIASVAKISTESLLGTAGQIVILDGRQLEDGLSPSCAGDPAADRPRVGTRPSVGIRPADSEWNNRQSPYGNEDPDQSRITHHSRKQRRSTGRVGQTTS